MEDGTDWEEASAEHEPERERARARAAVDAAATVSIVGLPLAAVENLVQDVASSTIQNAGFIEVARKEIARAAREAVATVTPEVVREQLGLEVAKVLAEGIPEFDHYSGKEKKRTSVHEMVVACLNAIGSDSRTGERNTVVHMMVKAAVQEVFNKELTKVVEDAKLALRQQVDAVVTGRLSEALRAALGVK